MTKQNCSIDIPSQESLGSEKSSSKKKPVLVGLLFFSPAILHGILSLIGWIVFDPVMHYGIELLIFWDFGFVLWMLFAALSIIAFVLWQVAKTEQNKWFIVLCIALLLFFSICAMLLIWQQRESSFQTLLRMMRFGFHASFIFAMVAIGISTLLFVCVVVFILIIAIKKLVFVIKNPSLQADSQKQANARKLLLFISPAFFYGFCMIVFNWVWIFRFGHFISFGLMSLSLFLSAGLYFIATSRKKQKPFAIVFIVFSSILAIGTIIFISYFSIYLGLYYHWLRIPRRGEIYWPIVGISSPTLSRTMLLMILTSVSLLLYLLVVIFFIVNTFKNIIKNKKEILYEKN